MSNLDVYILVGLLVCGTGIWSALVGRWTTRAKYTGKETVVYQGSALGNVVAISGGLIGLLAASPHFSKPYLTHDQAFKYIGYVMIGGIAISVVLLIINVFTRGGGSQASDATEVINRPMSLHDAAKYLKMPEAEVLKMAEDGAIEARHVNGKYLFDGEVLLAFRDLSGR